MDTFLDSKPFVVVVTAEGCGSCIKYHSRVESEVKKYISSRGDIGYQDLECTSASAGIAKIIVGVDAKGKQATKDMRPILGYPFEATYYYPKFVIYADNPALSNKAVKVLHVKPNGGSSYEDVTDWIAKCMSTPEPQQKSTPSSDHVEITSDDFKTTALIVSKKQVVKKKQSADGKLFIHEIVPEADMVCSSDGFCLPTGYERVQGKNANGNQQARRVKSTASSYASK